MYQLSIQSIGFRRLDLEDRKPNLSCLSWRGDSKIKSWQKPRLVWVEDHNSHLDDMYADINHFLLGTFVVNAKAYSVLKEVLHGQVEFLPVNVAGSLMHIVNVINVQDILIKEDSKYQTYPNGKVGACTHAFLTEPQQSESMIFKVTGFLPNIFINNALKTVLELNDLTGLAFHKYKNPDKESILEAV